MMDVKVRMGNKLLLEIENWLLNENINDAQHKAHQIMQIIASNKVEE